jgi:hypothetical protein
LREEDDQFARIDRFMALHNVATRYAQVENTDSGIVPEKDGLERYVGRTARPDRGLTDVFVCAKNLTLEQAAQLLSRVEDERTQFNPINRFDPTYKDYQTEMSGRAKGRKLLE